MKYSLLIYFFLLLGLFSACIASPPYTTATQVQMKAELTTGISCDGENMESISLEEELPIDEFGNVGYRGTTLLNGTKVVSGYYAMTECRLITEFDENGRPSAAKTLYRLKLDPNNGWIRNLYCDAEYYSGCPDNIDLSSTENPDYEDYLKLQIN
jgi:hypothetical protein